MRDICRLFLIVALSPACTGGCGPEPHNKVPDDAAERYAHAFCGALFACEDCLVRTEHASEAECISEVETRYQGGFDKLKGKASFNETCLESTIQQLDAGSACALFPAETQDCAIVSGTKQPGEVCTSPVGTAYFRVSDCEADLLCLDGSCRHTPIVASQDRGLGDECTAAHVCEDGLRCVEGICMEPVSAGETCVPNLCESPLHCNDDSVCTVDAEEGEACDTEGAARGCEPTKVDGRGARLWCVEGVCAGAQPGVCSTGG